MNSSLCPFCPPPIHPQGHTLSWLQHHLEHFHNITHKTEAAFSIAFLNSKEIIKLGQMVNFRMNKFFQKGEIDTNGNIFDPALYMVPWIDETLVKEDNHAKDKELSFQELDAIQDHLLADNLSN